MRRLNRGRRACSIVSADHEDSHGPSWSFSIHLSFTKGVRFTNERTTCERTAALLATSAVAAGGFDWPELPAAQADFDFERERSVMCKNSNAIASLSLEKEFGNRIEVDFEVENAVPKRT